jgi:hypothetical protein
MPDTKENHMTGAHDAEPIGTYDYDDPLMAAVAAQCAADDAAALLDDDDDDDGAEVTVERFGDKDAEP